VGRLAKLTPLLLGLLVLLSAAPSSASAVKLCEDSACLVTYPVPTTVKMIEVVGTPATFITQQETTKCGEDVGEFTTMNALSLEAKITTLWFSECLSGCNTVTATNLSWLAKIFTRMPAGNGVMTAEGSPLEMKLSGCMNGTSCTLTAKKIEFLINGGTPAFVQVKAALSGTAPCGSSVWTSTYKVVSQESLYVGT
jgi:hypothetical protein